jgi:hypothetical protein
VRLVGHWLDDGYDVVYTAKAHRESDRCAAGVKVFADQCASAEDPEDAGDFLPRRPPRAVACPSATASSARS